LPEKPRYKQALLIDDDEVDNFITRHVLRSASFAESIEIKSSVAEALSYVNALVAGVKNLPDIIFLDIAMPELDGFIFLEAFRKISDHIKMKSRIIVLTNAEAGEPTFLHAKNDPLIYSVMLKPLSVEALQKIS